ncbi:hypothetical protein [Mammaliicoccus lentus]|uniref:hypothetical protein n=1 Tax=Mammaliicoccus lentus TaxID=42858 RepID=UPI00143056C8|nr:hypothetical protein [Mammaliicoccus lentus]MBF0749768.1 hypothetical protein [Mammaliicoccus lentus]
MKQCIVNKTIVGWYNVRMANSDELIVNLSPDNMLKVYPDLNKKASIFTCELDLGKL